MGEMQVLDEKGDTKHIWDPEKEDEVNAAEALFDELVGKGYKAYNVDKKGERAKPMRRFDPDAGKVILAPPAIGG